MTICVICVYLWLNLLSVIANRLAIQLQAPATRENDIVRGKRAISADSALRLARYFGTTPQFWMHLQANYDLERAEDAQGTEIAERIRSHPGGLSQALKLPPAPSPSRP